MMRTAAKACGSLAVLAANAMLFSAHAENCLFELVPPEEPYYVAGSLVVPQSRSLAIADCGKTLEQVKADLERAAGEGGRLLWEGTLAGGSPNEGYDPEPDLSAGSSFRNCSAARAAGRSGILRGTDGYASRLDRDGDGIACE